MSVAPSPSSVARRLRAAVAAIALLALVIERASALPLPPDVAAGPAAIPGHLVVSELLTGGASASDEFIELYNPTATTQPLEGLEVVYVTSTGATVTRKAAWSAGAPGLPAGAHLLVANSAGIYAGVADVTYANGLAAGGGSVALRIKSATNAVDALGWGTAASTWLETRPAPAPATGSSLERLPGGPAGSGQDTDDNLVDFVTQPVPDPQNTGSAPIAIATPTPAPTDAASPSETLAPSASPSPETTPTPEASATPDPTATATAVDTPTPAPSTAPTASPSPSPTPEPAPISISEARSLPDGATVVVEGFALTAADFSDGGGYLTDGTAGIAVLVSDGSFARGQLLRVAGTLDDRYAQRTIRSSAAQVTPLGVGSEPLPIDADTGSVGESLEGQLVELTGLITSSATALSTGVAWDLDDGSGATRIVIGTATGIDTDGWGRGVGLTLIGVVGQRDSSGSGASGFRVQPRDPADIAAVEPAATATPSPTPTAEPTASATVAPSPIPSASVAPGPTAAPSATPSGAPLVSIGEARAAAVGAHLRIRGVVTAQSGLLEAGSAVVQDSTGAILVRLGSRAGTLALGRLVELDGTRATKAGMLSLRVTRPALLLGSVADPAPVRRTTGALGEAQEALLVISRGMVTSTISRPKSGTISFSIDDGSGPIRVSISPRSGIATGAIRRGAWLEVRGVLGQETTARAPLKGYRLWPRTRADLVVIAAPVAGGGGATTCCRPGSPTAAPHPGGRLPEAEVAGAVAALPGAAPILARPQPTLPAPAPITERASPGAQRHAPVEAGLVVSGLGLAALAGLAAWLGRRRRIAPPDHVAATTAAPDHETEIPLPYLSVVPVEGRDAPVEQRILPPT